MKKTLTVISVISAIILFIVLVVALLFGCFGASLDAQAQTRISSEAAEWQLGNGGPLFNVTMKLVNSAEWMADLHKSDMEKIIEKVEKVDRFEGYNLTPRQREVAALLLSSKTRRQIAGELKLSESTVKMHTSDLYRRLNISGISDLYRIFGVTPEEKSTSGE